MPRLRGRSLSFSVYHKPTHTHHYLQFGSNQPLQHKLGLIRTLVHRSSTICSNRDEQTLEIRQLKRVLTVSGYTKKAWRTATRARPQNASPSTQPSERVRKGSVTIHYVGQATEEIARLFRDRVVTTHIHPYNTIKATLVRLKDKLSMEEQCGVVYQITCANCPAAYVGETKRPLAKRLKEHQRPGSPVSDHLVEHNHSFTKEDVAVKHREKDWFRRGWLSQSTLPKNVSR